MKHLFRALIVALFCILLVIQSNASAVSPCKDKALMAALKVTSFSFEQTVPCAFKIILVGKDRVWRLASSGRAPLTISPIRGCAVKSLPVKPLSNGFIQTARIRVTGKTCEFGLWLRASENAPGFKWWFFLWDVARETHR